MEILSEILLIKFEEIKNLKKSDPLKKLKNINRDYWEEEVIMIKTIQNLIKVVKTMVKKIKQK